MRIADILKALAEPTRYTIVQILLREPGRTTGELATRTRSFYALRKHIQVLLDAQLIYSDPNRRPTTYYVNKGALVFINHETEGWLKCLIQTN